MELLEDQSSSWPTVASGVPQGGVLGALLFLIYINDLPDCITSSTVRPFADDMVLYHGRSSPAEVALSTEDEEEVSALPAVVIWNSLRDHLLSSSVSK